MVHSIPLRGIDLLNRAIEEHYEELKAALRRRGHGPETAVDIVHDVYVKFAENPDSLKRAHSLRAFLARAAINLGIDRARRAGFEQRLFSGTDEESLSVAAATPASEVRAVRATPARALAISHRPSRSWVSNSRFWLSRTSRTGALSAVSSAASRAISSGSVVVGALGARAARRLDSEPSAI